MNWSDYSEDDPLVWYNKIFNKNDESVNKWYNEATQSHLQFTPITESSGTQNDGIITVNMGKAHPGGANDTTFRNTEINNAITDNEVKNNLDMASFDTDNSGDISRTELQIIFIVAGGEEAFGDSTASSIWAHAWSFDSNNAPVVDGKVVMKYTGDDDTSGSYARFGANHGTHKAIIGIIAHELGHSLLKLIDYYDTPSGQSSGLGWYDIMSSGSWAKKSSDSFSGETPTLFSAYNRITMDLNATVTEVSADTNVTIVCSSSEFIKLTTTKTNEYFLIECRDTAKTNSDIAFNVADNSITENKLFMMTYHVDTAKANNNEDGTQTNNNHYKVSLIEKDTGTLMTATASIEADNNDLYTQGDVIDSTRTNLYDGTVTNYRVEVINEDYTNRTMSIKITK